MADDTALRGWISDRMHGLLGFTEKNVVTYISALSKKHSNPASLALALQSQGFPASEDTKRFADELLQRLPRQQKGPSDYQLQQRQAAAFVRRNATYNVLEDDHPAPAQPAAQEPSKADKRLRTKRPAGEDEQDPTIVRPASKQRKKWEENSGDEAETQEKRSERERERDQLERQEFETRLRAKDEANTKKLAAEEHKLSKKEREEEERRKYTDEESKKTLTHKLREYSRQEYLAKREDKKLEELKDELEDAKYLFQGVALTAKELADLKYKETTYKLAVERKQLLEGLKEEGYRLPDSYDAPEKQEDRFAVAKKRYQETEGEEERATPWTEQAKWEGDQLARTHMQFGSKDAVAAAQKEYEYLFDDQVDFVKHAIVEGTIDTFEDAKSAAEKEREARQAAAKNEREAIQMDRASLPIYAYRDELLKAIEENQILIIVAETGAGKTTQIPQYLHEAGYSKLGKIGCTQPRRVAAMSVAARVAHEMGVKLGAEVGYSIRFEDCTSDKTVLKYMTDGMLLREFLGEPDLASYSVMIVDEAHERTLHTDVLFGLVKDIARFRPDLKLLISSATLDAAKFSDYFDGAARFNVPGRRYSVDIFYTKAPEADYIAAAVMSVLQIHATQPLGDILVFLTGQEEIEACEELLRQRTRGLGSRIAEMAIAPIYANLPTELQAKIFEPAPAGGRKVVLATNIAETSLTIDGILYVIDPGFCKQNSYNPRSGMESLIITPISKASANQRAGRAGRTAPGKCFRLYTAWSYENEMEDNTTPEIQRTNLANVVLMLKSLGIHDLVNFDFMDPPPAECLLRALEQLYALGALNDKGELTKLGRRMAEFPLDPMLSKALLQSEKYGVSEEVASICAMVSIGSAVFYRPKDKAVHADNAHKNFSRGNVGDHLALLNVYDAWAEVNFSSQWCFENFVQLRSMKRARDIREQLTGLMERVEINMVSDTENHDGMKKAVAAGFFYNTARLQRDGSYRTVKHPQTVHIHPSSSLSEVKPRWVVYHELVLTSKEYMRTVSEIKPDWLVEIAPHYYSKADILEDGKKMPKGKGRAQMTAE